MSLSIDDLWIFICFVIVENFVLSLGAVSVFHQPKRQSIRCHRTVSKPRDRAQMYPITIRDEWSVVMTNGKISLKALLVASRAFNFNLQRTRAHRDTSQHPRAGAQSLKIKFASWCYPNCNLFYVLFPGGECSHFASFLPSRGLI